MLLPSATSSITRTTPRRRALAPGIAPAVGPALAFAIAWLAALLPASPAFAQIIPDEKPGPAQGLEIQNRLGEQMPLDLSFFDEQANAVHLSKYFNRPALDEQGQPLTFKKPVVVVMMYFSCPLQCPLITERLTQRLCDLDFVVGSDFDVVMVSFDPRDKPRDAALKKASVLISYNRPTTDSIRDGWSFLTSSPVSARSLADSLGFAFRYLPDSGEFAHPNMVYILTPDGKLSRTLNGVEFPKRDLRFALLEASSGKIGDSFDQFTLWCYHFDPDANSYTLQAMRVMQIAGSFTVLTLAVLLAFMLRLERRRAARRLAITPALSPDQVQPAIPSALPAPAASIQSTSNSRSDADSAPRRGLEFSGPLP